MTQVDLKGSITINITLRKTFSVHDYLLFVNCMCSLCCDNIEGVHCFHVMLPFA
jgi:hypothetical protein